MLNLVVFFLLFILFCLIARLALQQYPGPKPSRKKISTSYKSKTISKETQSIATSIGFLLVFLINISTNSFRPSYQIRDNSPVTILQDNGPSSDGTTTIELTNAVPSPFVFAIQQEKQKQELELASCKDCKLYANSTEVPENVCKLGTTTTIAATPGENRVHWYYKIASINPVNATWKISPGRKYSICIIVDLSKGRTDWDSK